MIRETSSVKMVSTIKSVTLRQSLDIQRSLNFTELLPALVHPEIRFLSTKELYHINSLSTDTEKANELLVILGRLSSTATSKFLISLWLTREHLGHEELFSNIFLQIPKDKVQGIIRTCKSLSSASPARSPAFVELQGDLTDDMFLKTQRNMWELFGLGRYSKIAEITAQLRSGPSVDWAIVGMWFESLNCTFIHGCKDHEMCLSNLLVPALEKCKDPRVANQNILEGRIYLHLSQTFLTRGEKALAKECSGRAKDLLLFSQGYDKATFLFRQANVFSALSVIPRKELEMM